MGLNQGKRKQYCNPTSLFRVRLLFSFWCGQFPFDIIPDILSSAATALVLEAFTQHLDNRTTKFTSTLKGMLGVSDGYESLAFGKAIVITRPSVVTPRDTGSVALPSFAIKAH